MMRSVRVTELSGQEFPVTLGGDDTFLTLRQKVSDRLGVPMWKLRLLHGTQILRAGQLRDLADDGDTEVEVMAIQVTDEEVLQRSREVFENLSISYHGYYLPHHFKGAMEIICNCNGEVDFNFEGWNFLELAIRHDMWCKLDHVNLLLKFGASVNNPSRNGRTPLLSVLDFNRWPWHDNREIVETLLRHRADPNAKSLDGSTPLLTACEMWLFHSREKDEIVETLLRHGGDDSAKSWYSTLVQQRDGDDYFLNHWEAYKERNRKCDTRNHRRSHRVRVPVASWNSSKTSSCLANKMPAAYRDFHVPEIRHFPRKGGKFQDLDLDH